MDEQTPKPTAGEQANEWMRDFYQGKHLPLEPPFVSGPILACRSCGELYGEYSGRQTALCPKCRTAAPATGYELYFICGERVSREEFERAARLTQRSRGWECPRCHVVHAPSVLRCECPSPALASLFETAECAKRERVGKPPAEKVEERVTVSEALWGFASWLAVREWGKSRNYLAALMSEWMTANRIPQPRPGCYPSNVTYPPGGPKVYTWMADRDHE